MKKNMLPKKLHLERNWFQTLTSPLTREMFEPDSGRVGLVFKMTWGGQMFVFSDKNQSRKVLDCKRKSKLGMNWEVFDAEGQKKKLGEIKWNVIGTTMALGAESWDIIGADGEKLLFLEREGHSAVKRLADGMSALIYNPSHQYLIKNTGGGDVARISVKHGLWKHYYDFELIGLGEDEQKMALSLFAAMTLMLKK